ncbi:unnamed protein product [Xylocopa violacea]|uniref:Gustatory receptor n=1 Tax=Xylocopa violacea TaxID=135666 RepID=A0ABP1NJC9_XYLVO
MYEPKTIRHAILPLSWINFLLGMAVFNLELKRFTKLFEYLYTLCFLVVLNMVGFFWLTHFSDYVIIYAFDMTQVVLKVIFCLNMLVMNVLVIASRYNAQKLRSAIMLIESCNQKLETMGLPNKYQDLFEYQITSLTLSGCCIFLYMAVVYYFNFKESTPPLMKLCLTLIAIISSINIAVCSASFCTWIKYKILNAFDCSRGKHYLKLKFGQLNKLLRGMLTTTKNSPQHKRVLAMNYDFKNKKFTSLRNDVKGSDGNASTMRAVKQVHLELIKISRIINASYGIQVLLMMTLSSTFTIGFLYISYRIIWMDLTTDELLHELIPTLCCIFINMWQMFYVNRACTKTSIEAEDIGDIVCELYEPSTSKEFRAEIQDFTLQLIQNPLVFTACGFFDLGNTFIQGVHRFLFIIGILEGEMNARRLFVFFLGSRVDHYVSRDPDSGWRHNKNKVLKLHARHCRQSNFIKC